MNDLTRENENNYLTPFYKEFFGELDHIFESAQQPGYEFVENESHYLVSIDMPGVRADEIKITIEENILKVKASRRSEQESKNYSFSFLLRNNVQYDAEVKANYEIGVLSIAIPKSQESNSREISISSDDSDGFFKKLFSSRK